ncbi:hypothetical protein EAH89_25195 [Roseomonas nepalensis]|uniref:Uncharacterized protein n=1 Tax=Muricoccus nepalensis TaxID=1854500 RepID=A0A502F9I0_9PROT|nr:hypothetical protein EAH89_25195 [Roseomonas nepalensis]
MRLISGWQACPNACCTSCRTPLLFRPASRRSRCSQTWSHAGASEKSGTS